MNPGGVVVLALWIGAGLALETVLYGLQRRYLRRSSKAAPSARVQGLRRAAQRQRWMLWQALRPVLALVVLGTGAAWGASLTMPGTVALWTLAIFGDEALQWVSGPSHPSAARAPQMLCRRLLVILLVGAGMLAGLQISEATGAAASVVCAWLFGVVIWHRWVRGGRAAGPVGAVALAPGALRERLGGLVASVGQQASGFSIWEHGPIAALPAARVVSEPRGCRVEMSRALIETFSTAEVVAVAAHELGHVCCGHLTRYDRLCFGLLLVYVGLGAAMLWAVGPYPPLTLYGLWLLWVSLAAARWPALPLLHGFRRRCEFEADRFAADRAGPAVLRDTLVRLFAVNAHRAGQHRLYHGYHATHPRDADRLAAIADVAR